MNLKNKRWLNRDEALKYLIANECEKIGKYKVALKHEGYDAYRVYKKKLYKFSDRYLYWWGLAYHRWWGVRFSFKRSYLKEKAKQDLLVATSKKEKRKLEIKIRNYGQSFWSARRGMPFFPTPADIYVFFFHIFIKSIFWRWICGSKSKYDLVLLEAIIMDKNQTLADTVWNYERKEFIIKYDQKLQAKQKKKEAKVNKLKK